MRSAGCILGMLVLVACAGPPVRRHHLDCLEVAAPVAGPPETLPLLVHLPRDYGAHPERRWPVLVFLHGIFVEGSDPDYMTRAGLPAMLEGDFDPPFIVASPQQRTLGATWRPRHFRALLRHLETRYRIDPARVHLTGVSLGATAGWEIVKDCPERIASFVPISGFGSVRGVERMREVPVWAFYGALDPFAPPLLAARAARAHCAVGGDTRITVLPFAMHWIQERVYGSPTLWAWWARTRRGGVNGPPLPCSASGTRRGSAGRTRRPPRCGRSGA
jgi:poly(3-hydroxybutyrate) depolymerase